MGRLVNLGHRWRPYWRRSRLYSSLRLQVLYSEWVSSFLTAHQHILGYLVPYKFEVWSLNVNRFFKHTRASIHPRTRRKSRTMWSGWMQKKQTLPLNDVVSDTSSSSQHCFFLPLKWRMKQGDMSFESEFQLINVTRFLIHVTSHGKRGGSHRAYGSCRANEPHIEERKKPPVHHKRKDAGGRPTYFSLQSNKLKL